MDYLTVDWQRAEEGRAYVVWVRNGERQELRLTAEEIKALNVDYERTQIHILLPIPPELERLSRRIMRRARKSKSAQAR